MFHRKRNLVAPVKLGKRPPRVDSRTLRLAKYLGQQGTDQPALAPAPPAIDWTAKVSSWPMMANDALGDCTCAAAGHMIECWTANLGDPFTPSSAQIIAAYSATSGYVSGDPATDNGAVELDVLNYWRQQGIAGHKIDAYAALDLNNAPHDPANNDMHSDACNGVRNQSRDTAVHGAPSQQTVQECVRQAIALFGGAYIGLALPLSAQQQDVWDVPSAWSRLRSQSAPGSWGGHAVPVLAYDADGLTCITWGAKKRMTWGFFAQYCDEAYAPLSRDWLNAQGTNPSGLEFGQLQSDLSALAALS